MTALLQGENLDGQQEHGHGRVGPLKKRLSLFRPSLIVAAIVLDTGSLTAGSKSGDVGC